MQKITPHLWLHKEAAHAAEFYVSAFWNGSKTKTYETLRALEDGDLVAVSGKAGNVFNSERSATRIVRFEGDKIIEEWEASREALKDSHNKNGLF